jgi:RES domain-containing protein
MSGILPAGGLFLVTLEVPDAAYEGAFEPELPADWATLTEDPVSTAQIGREWLEKGEELAMRVPSVVCPTDFNLLLNPLHMDFAANVKVISKVPFKLDPRLFGSN